MKITDEQLQTAWLARKQTPKLLHDCCRKPKTPVIFSFGVWLVIAYFCMIAVFVMDK